MSLFSDKDDEERFWNLAMFHFYGTNKEMEEFAPVGCVIVIIIAIVLLAFWIF